MEPLLLRPLLNIESLACVPGSDLPLFSHLSSSASWPPLCGGCVSFLMGTLPSEGLPLLVTELTSLAHTPQRDIRCCPVCLPFIFPDFFPIEAPPLPRLSHLRNIPLRGT